MEHTVGGARTTRTAANRLETTSNSCILVCMRTTLNLDEDLVRQALRETGAKSKTEVIEMGLKALLEREARKRLKALGGKLPELEPVRRRRA